MVSSKLWLLLWSFFAFFTTIDILWAHILYIIYTVFILACTCISYFPDKILHGEQVVQVIEKSILKHLQDPLKVYCSYIFIQYF